MFLFYFLFSFLLTSVDATVDPLQCSSHGHPEVVSPPSIYHPLPYLKIPKPRRKQEDPQQNYQLSFKLLLLSATNNPVEEPSLELIKMVLTSYHIPFDHQYLTANGKRLSDQPISLINQDTSGKYYGIITTTGQLNFKNERGEMESALTPEQWGLLEKYENDFRIRRVSLYSFPHNGIGVEQSGGFLSPESTHINFNNLSKINIDIDSTGLQKNIDIPASKIWFYPTQVKDANKAVPFLFFEYEGKKNVGSIIATFPDKRKQMHFFFSQDQNSLASILISSLWINWLTKGVYQGKRRIHFNIQVDDFFLSTRLWESSKSEIYRINQNEIASFITWQKGMMQYLSGNRNYKIELAFNGWGVLDNGTIAHDQLYLYLKSRVEEFNWVSHTYSHPILNDMAFDPIDSDLKKNVSFADNFFGPFKNYFSFQSIVTPGISGLFNKEAINAFFNNQIIFAIGDNSRPELAPLKLYNARYSTEELNGKSGLLIIPRYPTQVYFNVSTPPELTAQYNVLYPQLGGKVGFEQIYSDEVKRVSRLLFLYDPSAHMFHQANLRLFNYGENQVSLLSLWMNQIAIEVRKYMTLPILSLKMDDLALMYKDRIDTDNCQAQAKLVINNQKLTSIKYLAEKNCKVEITGIEAVIGNGITVEKYGPDQTTYFDPLAIPIINLKTPLAF